MYLQPFSFKGILQIAVMPSVLFGGPLVLLALFFPAICVGLASFLQRWRTVLSVLSLCSILYLFNGWFYSYFFSSWWESQLELWFCTTVIAISGLLSQKEDPKSKDSVYTTFTARSDLLFLGITMVLCGIGIFCGLWYRPNLFSPYARPLLIMEIAATAGFMYAFRYPRATKLQGNSRHWNTQGVVLLAAVIASTFFFGKIGIQSVYGNSLHLRWSFVFPEEGAMYSSPIVVGDRVFAASALCNSTATGGSLYCLNRNTGELSWTFNDRGEMKQVLSSPCYADDRIYIGEGFHSDAPCKLYCVSAHNGEKIWDFETSSHTESTPSVADGRVYFGAGDDGLYCLNSRTGKMLWHFKGPHVDSCPTVFGGCVYAGSGYGECEVFCVNAVSGNPIWRVPVEVSSFGSATVSGDRVFFGVGDGTFVGGSGKTFGSLLCLDCKSGNIKWRYNIGDVVHSKPLAIGSKVYFVSRDCHCYCVEIDTGNLRWKRDLGAPIIAAPIIARFPQSLNADGICVLTKNGCLYYLSPETGLPYIAMYTGDFIPVDHSFISTPTIAFNPSAMGDRHQVYFGGASRQIVLKPTLFCFE